MPVLAFSAEPSVRLDISDIRTHSHTCNLNLKQFVEIRSFFFRTESTVSASNDAYSRTLITFTDEDAFYEVFNHEPRAPPVKPICPVTRLQARYFDPVTKTAYANAHAFKVLRDAYHRKVDETLHMVKCKPKLPYSL